MLTLAHRPHVPAVAFPTTAGAMVEIHFEPDQHFDTVALRPIQDNSGLVSD
jgi:hypothetical protein